MRVFEAGLQPATVDWDQPGVLTIVVQGGLGQGNLIETATHCQHWRRLFPAADIILSLSGSDILCGDVSDGVLASLRLTPALQYNTQFQAAIRTIEAACDKVALAEPALPLPPIKSDSPKPNNMNLQMAAAQRGLSLATGRFVLRIRADLIFLDRRFLKQYERAVTMPRGDAARFEQRVLISWLFTLNPFTIERLPLHFSDWFHFGLAEDVRRIWNVRPVELADSMYYRGRPHAPGSNAAERMFNTRLAVEQHLIFECFKPSFPELTLDYHNDRSSIALAMDILLDNFALCDLDQAGCVFEKYAVDFVDHAKTLHCITSEDWYSLVQARDQPHEITLAGKIIGFQTPTKAELARPLPRTFAASRLSTQIGRRVNGEIVAVDPDGVLFWGPYTALPRGRYTVDVETTSLEGTGTVVLRVCMNSNRDLLAEKIIVIDPDSPSTLSVDFDVAMAQALEVEVICRFEKLRTISIAGLTFSRRDEGGLPAPLFQQSMPQRFASPTLSTRDGSRAAGEIVLSGVSGRLFYGPYATIAPGKYKAKVELCRIAGAGMVDLSVVVSSGLIATARLQIAAGESPEIAIPFDVAGKEATRLEIVCDVSGLDLIAVSAITLDERKDVVSFPVKRRLFGR